MNADDPTEQSATRGWVAVAFTGVITLLLLCAALALPVRTAEHQVDAVSGSRRTWTTAWWGGGAATEEQASALERWCVDRGVALRRDWVTVGRQRLNVFGGMVTIRRGDPLPAVTALTAAPEGFTPPLDAWLARVPEERVRALVDAVSSGDTARRDDAVRGVIEAWGQ